MSPSQAAISLVNVVRRFGSIRAVDGISLEISKGEFVVIMGPSGCGKTSTLRLIAGLEEPQSGDILIDGVRVNDLKPWQRDVPLVWQNFMLFPHLTVLQNIEYGLKMRKVPSAERNERAVRILRTVGLEGFETRSVVKLSGGQKQRVGLARALVLNPKVLLLDEPLGALDAKIARLLQQELKRLHRLLGITFVYVTHNQSEAMTLADRIVLMNEGKIQQVGTPIEVSRSPQNRFVAEFVGANSVIEGHVASISEDGLRIDTSTGTVEAKPPKSRTFAQGQVVTLVIGADRIAFSEDIAGTPNRVSARVVAIEVNGSAVTTFLATEQNQEFQVQQAVSEFARSNVEVGKSLQLSWKAEDVYVLPEVSN